jgi:hypothetical protein
MALKVHALWISKAEFTEFCVVITGGGPKVPPESNRLKKSRMDILIAVSPFC